MALPAPSQSWVDGWIDRGQKRRKEWGLMLCAQEVLVCHAYAHGLHREPTKNDRHMSWYKDRTKMGRAALDFFFLLFFS